MRRALIHHDKGPDPVNPWYFTVEHNPPQEDALDYGSVETFADALAAVIDIQQNPAKFADPVFNYDDSCDRCGLKAMKINVFHGLPYSIAPFKGLCDYCLDVLNKQAKISGIDDRLYAHNTAKSGDGTVPVCTPGTNIDDAPEDWHLATDEEFLAYERYWNAQPD